MGRRPAHAPGGLPGDRPTAPDPGPPRLDRPPHRGRSAIRQDQRRPHHAALVAAGLRRRLGRRGAYRGGGSAGGGLLGAAGAGRAGAAPGRRRRPPGSARRIAGTPILASPEEPGERSQPGATSSEMVVPARALLTGQVLLASCAILANSSGVTPSAEPLTVSAMPVMRKPPAGSGPRLTSALTSRDCPLPPASPSM